MANFISNLFKAKAPKLDPELASLLTRFGSTGEGYNGGGGYTQSREQSMELNGSRKYTTYANYIANVHVVALGVRYILDILGGTRWKFTPSEADTDARYAGMVDSIITGMSSPWGDHLQKMGMYKFNGAAIHEWVAMRRPDGLIGIQNLEHRPMHTVTRWSTDDAGINGVYQRARNTGTEIMMPREKLVYVVDSSISDSPEGVGLLRHVAEPARQLQRLEQLEGYGYEMDVNGVPKLWIPYAKLNAAVKSKAMEKKDADAVIANLESFQERHIKNPSLGISLESAPYTSMDASSSPSSMRMFDLEILSSQNSSAGPINIAVERKCREIARVLGIEALLLGTGGSAQASVSRDKVSQLQQTVMRMNTKMAWCVDKDLVRRIGQLNGWDEKFLPASNPDPVSLRDINEIVAAITALAGAPFREGDTAENEIRSMIGISPAPEILAGSQNQDGSIDIDMGGL